MSDDKGTSGADGKGGADATDDQTTDNTSGADGKNQVSYDTYKKTLSEAKSLKKRLAELESKMSSADADKLQAEGKKDELIAKLRGDLDKATKTHKDTLNSFIFQSLDNQVRQEAAKLGCVDLDAAVKLADLSDIEVDPKTFEADKKALIEALDGLKKARPYLFQKAAPKLNTKMPEGKVVDAGTGKKLSELSTQEIWASLRALQKQ